MGCMKLRNVAQQMNASPLHRTVCVFVVECENVKSYCTRMQLWYTRVCAHTHTVACSKLPGYELSEVCVCANVFVPVRTFLVRVAVCLASVELLPDQDLMSPELLHLWVCVCAFQFLSVFLELLKHSLPTRDLMDTLFVQCFVLLCSCTLVVRNVTIISKELLVPLNVQ